MAGRSDPQSLPRGGGKVVFARIYPPRPLPPAALEQVLVRLASDATSAPVVFEVRSRADAHGSSQVSYWIGTTPPHLRWLRRTLHDLLPGLLVDAEPLEARRPVTTAARVKVRPRGLALAVERPEAISTAILSALNQQLYAGEELVLQLVFGPRRAPRHVRGKLADPGQPWWTLPTTGVRDAPAAVVRQHSQRALQAGMATCIRLGLSPAPPTTASTQNNKTGSTPSNTTGRRAVGGTVCWSGCWRGSRLPRPRTPTCRWCGTRTSGWTRHSRHGAGTSPRPLPSWSGSWPGPSATGSCPGYRRCTRSSCRSPAGCERPTAQVDLLGSATCPATPSRSPSPLPMGCSI